MSDRYSNDWHISSDEDDETKDTTNSLWNVEEVVANSTEKNQKENEMNRCNQSTPKQNLSSVFNATPSMGSSNRIKWASGSWDLPEISNKTNESDRKIVWKEFKEKFEYHIKIRGEAEEDLKLLTFRAKCTGWLQAIVKRVCAIEELENLKELMNKIDGYFDETYSSFLEVEKFSTMLQKKDESFGDWATRVSEKAALCDFNKDSKRMIIGQLIAGARTDIRMKLKEKMVDYGMEVNKYITFGTTIQDIAMKEEKEKPNCEEDSKELDSVNWSSVKRYGGNSGRQEERQFRDRSENFSGYQARGYRHGGWNEHDTSRFRARGESSGFRPSSGHSFRPSPYKWNNSSTERTRGKAPCPCCGLMHEKGSCFAEFTRCFQCGAMGHYARCCDSARKHSKETVKDNIRQATQKEVAAVTKVNQVDNMKDESSESE